MNHTINMKKIDRISNDVNLIKINAILQHLFVLNFERVNIKIVAKNRMFFYNK